MKMHKSMLAHPHVWPVVVVLLLLVAAASPSGAAPPPADGNQMCPVTPEEPAKARYAIEHGEQTIYFCCGRCAGRFRRDPERYLAVLATLPADGHADHDHEHDHAEDAEHAADDDAHADHQHEDVPRLLAWLGHFHVVVVHFPIGLLLAGAIGELLHLATRRPWLRDGVRFSIWGGAIGAVLAAPLGWFLAGWDLTHDDWLLGTHRWLGTLVFFWAVALVAVMELRRTRPQARWAWGYLALLFSGALLVAITGHFGGMLVFGPEYLAW